MIRDVLAPTDADVTMLLAEVWASYVDAEPLVPGPTAASDDCWSATTTVSGAWRGTVSVQLSAEAAQRAAALMVGVAAATTVEVADAVGELANMVGGNVKSLMPDPSSLSLPVVRAGTITPPSDAIEVAASSVSWRGLPVSAHVHLLTGPEAEGATR